ncbi:hypothetical protein PRUB_a3409 [Pseudoalteromonas rubra]|uniref:Uncharacterized protein n=1 Tax=Pseudoalteromonas rubra TaxID=43658 RepID=A0A8T0C2Z1_9GAMM|nr:hypothetical protein PRUB_a3409 [Pseudoalteromonas rubra]
MLLVVLAEYGLVDEQSSSHSKTKSFEIKEVTVFIASVYFSTRLNAGESE